MSEYDVIILSSKMSDNYCSENKKKYYNGNSFL